MRTQLIFTTSKKTGIQWTDTTWNPTTGCTKISPGCKNCYADAMSKRLKKMGQYKYRNEFAYTEHYNELDRPFLLKKPLKIFVDSMSDLFHEHSNFDFTCLVFDTMMRANWHTYQILTKRPERMRDFVKMWLVMKQLEKIPSHIWLGTSVESNAYHYRIGVLRSIPAHIRFASIEPLLEPLEPLNLDGIQWVICGGESGRGYRHFDIQWAREIRDKCKAQGVAFFFKQVGGIHPKAKGRLLDGVEHSEFPKMEVIPCLT